MTRTGTADSVALPSKQGMSESNIEKLLAHGEVYIRNTAVKAVRLAEPLTIEGANGAIVSGQVGDYLVENVVGNTNRWIFPAAYFQTNYRHYLMEESMTPSDTEKTTDFLKGTKIPTKKLRKLSDKKEIVFER